MNKKLLGVVLTGLIGLGGCATADRGQFADIVFKI